MFFKACSLNSILANTDKNVSYYPPTHHLATPYIFIISFLTDTTSEIRRAPVVSRTRKTSVRRIRSMKLPTHRLTMGVDFFGVNSDKLNRTE